MPAIYQPLKPSGLLQRLGYAHGRIILEGGVHFTASARDWVEGQLRRVREEDAEAVSEEEITQVIDSAKGVGMAASMSVIRERVSHLAADLPQDLGMDGWTAGFCQKSDCMPFPHGVRFKKSDDLESPAVNTFVEALEACNEAVRKAIMTPDQAVRLLNQVGELPVDAADLNRRVDALPEKQRGDMERARAAQLAGMLGGAVIMDEERDGRRMTAIGIGLPPAIAELLTDRFGRRDDD